MWRSRLGWAGLASLLLHMLVLALLWDGASVRPPAPAPARSEPLLVEVLSSPTEPPAARAPPPPEPEQPRPPPPQPPPRPAPPPPEAPPTPEAPSRVEAPPTPEAPATSEQPSPPEAPAEVAAVEQEPPAAEPAAPEPPPAEARPSGGGPEQPPLAQPTPGPSEDAPLAEGKPLLLPPSPQGGWSLPSAPETPRGRTLRPGDPSLAPEVLAAEEHARVTGRVQGFMRDELATQRVENGLVHPYFGRLRAAMEKQFEGAPIFGAESLGTSLGKNLQHMVRNYEQDAARFGATGSPGGRVPSAPTPSEMLKQRVGEETAYRGLRARLQVGEELRTLGDGGRGSGLVVILELEQGPDGALRSVQVVKASGNTAYDTYVREKVPPALATLAPPPPNASGVRPEGIHTVWSVEGRVMYRRKLSELKGEDAWYLAAMAAGGVLTGSFEETTGDVYVIDLRNPWFSVQPRLLRVY